jgi:hypothetical protein
MQARSEVADLAMAAEARQLRPLVSGPLDSVHDMTMTCPARLLSDCLVTCPNPQVFWEASGGKGKRVPEAVQCLSEILGEEAWWRMAIIADCGAAVAGFDPPVILLLHDVTVGTCRRIIGQV